MVYGNPEFPGNLPANIATGYNRDHVSYIPGKHGRIVQAVMVHLFLGGYCLDFSYAGAGVCPSCVIIPSDVCLWDFLRFSALNAGHDECGAASFGIERFMICARRTNFCVYFFFMNFILFPSFLLFFVGAVVLQCKRGAFFL